MSARPAAIAAGTDGALWFNTVTGIGRITVHGRRSAFFIRTSRGIGFLDLAAAPDGRLWFAEDGGPTAVGTLDVRRVAGAAV